jgi:hypothetical protein
MEPDSTEQDQQKNISDRPDRKRFTRKKLYLIIVTALIILTPLLFYAVNVYHTPTLNELLTRARLAKFPESIKNLQVDMRPYMDDDLGRAAPNTGELLVRFEAEPNDIEHFINNSPGIDKNSVRQAGPLPESEQVPTWWPTDDPSGRMYVIHGLKDINGMVAVYDDSNTVRIFLWYVIDPQIPKMQNAIEDIYDETVDFLEDVLHEVVDLFD